eukprot:3941718-Rhodomonas_salina.2
MKTGRRKPHDEYHAEKKVDLRLCEFRKGGEARVSERCARRGFRSSDGGFLWLPRYGDCAVSYV